LGAAAAVTGPPRSTGPPAAVRSALKKGTDSGILIQVARHRAHFRPPPPARRQPASAATVRPAARAGGTGESARNDGSRRPARSSRSRGTRSLRRRRAPSASKSCVLATACNNATLQMELSNQQHANATAAQRNDAIGQQPEPRNHAHAQQCKDGCMRKAARNLHCSVASAMMQHMQARRRCPGRSAR
jgi:hypothetical protein